MSTVEDYILLRSDLSPLERPYQEIDFSVLALLAYVDFSPVVSMESEPKTLSEVYAEMKLFDPNRDFENKYMKILVLAAPTRRYGNIQVRYYFKESSELNTQQFAAVTFILEDGRIVVSFRGTDHSLVGWKENFLMLYQDSIPSEEKAVEYLNQIQVSYPLNAVLKDEHYGKNWIDRFKTYQSYKKNLPIIFVGHSKGGHLALYAGTIFQKEVYNYDGPGMNSLLEEYQDNAHQVHSYIPEYSLFGRFFTHIEPLQVVKSIKERVNQHALASWNVTTNGFEEGVLNEASTKALDHLFEFLDELTNEEKKNFIDAMFDTFESLNMKEIDDVRNINFHRLFSGIDSIRKLDSRTRNNMIEMITILYNEFK